MQKRIKNWQKVFLAIFFKTSLPMILITILSANLAYARSYLPQQGPEAPDLPCPVGYWHLDQCYGGNFIGPGSTGDLTCDDSPFQFAATFDGVDDMIEVPDQPAFHFTAAMTVAAWVKPTSTAGLRTIVNKWYSPDSYLLRIADGHFQFCLAFPGGPWGQTESVSFPAEAATWTHVAGVYDGHTIRLYLNGQLVASKDAAHGNIQDSARPLVIGNHPVWSAFQGQIDEIRLYNVALSSTQLKALAQLDPSPQVLILIDDRLYTELSSEIDQYRCLAKTRSGLGIALHDVAGIDDWSHQKVRDYLISQRNNPQREPPMLEGVLFIGNIGLPSFCFEYGWTHHVSLLPSYYEDLDATFSKVNPNDRVEPYDYDTIQEGNNPGPEIWTAFLPVGFADSANNTYTGFAEQIRPYLSKVLNFHRGQVLVEKKFYQVSNQLWYGLGESWDYYGPQGIDFYAVNPDPAGTVPSGTPSCEYCLRNGGTAEDCYQRAPIEQYATFDDFWQYYITREWMGECWQDGAIYKEHMKNHTYEFVWVNTHASEMWSIISSGEARNLINGGIVMLGSGCNVGRFKQPRADTDVSSVFPDDNLLLNYIYGSSSFITATGTTFTRQWEPRYVDLLYLAHQEPYLGKAYLEARRRRGMSAFEILLGDPFVTFRPTPVLTFYFEDNGRTTTDSSGNGNDGIVNGAVLSPGGGILNSNAYQFAWSDANNIQVPYQESQTATEALTLEAWIYPIAWDNIYYGYNRIVSKQPVYLLRGKNNGHAHFQIFTENHGYQGVMDSEVMTLNQWHYVVGTFDGRYLKLYVDGILRGTTELPEEDSISTNGSDIFVGESPRLAEGFTGTIDNVAIYKRTKLQGEIEKAWASVMRCKADFDGDKDVDGSDLATLAANPGMLDLATFSANFGKTM